MFRSHPTIGTQSEDRFRRENGTKCAVLIFKFTINVFASVCVACVHVYICIILSITINIILA